MSPSDAPFYIDEPSLFRRAAWPQIAALAGIALAALAPLVAAVVLAS